MLPVGQIPEPDGDQPMTATEFVMVRLGLGVTGDWIANHLGVNPRTVRRWEFGGAPVPDGVREELERLEEVQAGHVGVIVARLNDAAEQTLLVPRGEWEGWPAGWWLAVAYEVARAVPGVYVDAIKPEKRFETSAYLT